MADVELRKATWADAELLFEWANEPEIRAQSFHPDPISWESHCRWFKARIADPNGAIYIGYTADTVPVGQVRLELQETGDAVVDIHTAKSQRGRGFGAPLLISGVSRYFVDSNCERVTAVVKQSNKASLRIFEKAGFTVQQKSIMHGHDCVELSLSRSE